MSCRAVRVGFYPLALAATLAYIFFEVGGGTGGLGRMYPGYLIALITIMVTLERVLPMRPEWGMSKSSFFARDLPMLAINGAAIGATTFAMTWMARHWGAAAPVHPDFPWWIQTLLALMMSDFAWYWVHRWSHEGTGIIGRWLWKTHAMHHFPEQVYVFMHPAAHPINSAYVRVILMAPAIFLGFSPEAVFAASVFNGFQGLVSHFNVDSRAGWFNRLFIGTELHRFHHSANVGEAKNYAAVFSIWDQMFGTFSHPGVAPDKLGVEDRVSYPDNRQWLRLLVMPFH